MRRIARIALAAALAAAAAQAVRWLLGRDRETAPERPSPEPAPAQPTMRNGASPMGASAAGGPTREQLYQEARRLEIEGRSKMNKQELQNAVEAAKIGGAV
jgi:hypothetical protein